MTQQGDAPLNTTNTAEPDLAELDAKLAELIAGFAGAVERLDEIPGLGQTAARLLLAEVRRVDQRPQHRVLVVH